MEQADKKKKQLERRVYTTDFYLCFQVPIIYPCTVKPYHITPTPTLPTPHIPTQTYATILRLRKNSSLRKNQSRRMMMMSPIRLFCRHNLSLSRFLLLLNQPRRVPSPNSSPPPLNLRSSSNRSRSSSRDRSNHSNPRNFLFLRTNLPSCTSPSTRRLRWRGGTGRRGRGRGDEIHHRMNSFELRRR